MAIRAFNTGARIGTAAVEITNGIGYWLIVRVPGDDNGGFEVGFEVGFDNMSDADAVKATAKDAAPSLAAEIDAAFA